LVEDGLVDDLGPLGLLLLSPEPPVEARRVAVLAVGVRLRGGPEGVLARSLSHASACKYHSVQVEQPP
jgi:hypothetical protein